MTEYVVVTTSTNSISVVNQPTTIVVGDQTMRGPTGPQGPAGPGANAAYAQANAAYSQANAAYNQANTNYLPAVTRLVITNNGTTSYRFDQYGGSVDNPTIYVRAGETLAFNLNNSGHPFAIRVSNGGANYNTGLTHVATDGTVSTDGFAQAKVSGTLYWKVPYELGGNTYVYQCTVHNGMVGDIVIEPSVTVVYNQANTARIQANTATSLAGNAYSQANAAYGEANLKLNISGGTINGSLNVSGNLFITGNTTYYNVTSYSVDDPLIYLAANNDTSDLVDIGFLGGHNTSGIYQHSGLARDAGDGTWYLFTGLSEEGHVNNIIDFANTTLALLRANVAANSILLMGNVVATESNVTLAYNQANNALSNIAYAYDQANNARTTANDAYGTANTAQTVSQNAYSQANTANNNAFQAYDLAEIARNQANTARNTANSSYDQANTARTTANDAYGAANTANTNALNAYGAANVAYNDAFQAYTLAETARNQANTARNTANNAYAQSNAAYGQANTARTTANDAYGQANTARDTANAAYAAANSAGGTAKITANSGSQVSTANINFVNTSTVTVSVVSGDNGNANVSFTSVGGGSTIAAPNTTVLVANLTGAGVGTNNFVFNVATNRMGVGTNTPNSNIAVVGNVWVTTGINAATVNVTTGNINAAVMNSATIVTANMTTGNITGTLTVGSTISVTGATYGDLTGGNNITSNTFTANANIQQVQYTLSTVPGNIAITQGSTVNINNFSGMIIINNWTSGGIQMWLVGGGAVGNVGNTLDLTISNTGSITHSSPNYVWTAANTATYSFATVKTRDAG